VTSEQIFGLVLGIISLFLTLFAMFATVRPDRALLFLSKLFPSIFKKPEPEDIRKRINISIDSIKDAVKALKVIERELEKKREVAENLEKELEMYDTLSKLKKKEADAILLGMELTSKKYAKVSIWATVIVGLSSAIFGAVMTLLIV